MVTVKILERRLSFYLNFRKRLYQQSFFIDLRNLLDFGPFESLCKVVALMSKSPIKSRAAPQGGRGRMPPYNLQKIVEKKKKKKKRRKRKRRKEEMKGKEEEKEKKRSMGVG